MHKVVTQKQWLRWCADRHLRVSTARFALETCYYGLCFRSRPGTLLLTDNELIHYSYSVRDTLYAVFEPSVAVSVPLRDVHRVVRMRLRFWTLVAFAFPDSAFRFFTGEGCIHDLLLQQRGDEFAKELRSLGLTVLDERRVA